MNNLRRMHLHLPEKATISKLRLSASSSRSPFSSSPSTSTSSAPPPPPSTSETATLTEEELNKINLLIPRLCDTNQLPTALRLVNTALLTNPPPHSLSLSPLIDALTSHRDLTYSLSLLAHSHSRYSRSIALSLLSSYLRSRTSTPLAFKLFRWLHKPHSPCSPDHAIYDLLVRGLSSNGFLLDALKILRDMIFSFNSIPSSDSVNCLYRGLLKEARVHQGLQFNSALSDLELDDRGREKVLTVLNRLIDEWTD